MTAKRKEDGSLNGHPMTNEIPGGQGVCLVAYEESLARLGGDKELFKEFIQIFFEDSPKLLEKLFTAVDSTDHDGVAMSAHALKGLISNFGAKPCCELALEFELAGKNKVSETMVADKDKLQQLYDQLCTELKQYTV